MLDTDTKRRIDTARDILVGKVPDLTCGILQSTRHLFDDFWFQTSSGIAILSIMFALLAIASSTLAQLHRLDEENQKQEAHKGA